MSGRQYEEKSWVKSNSFYIDADNEPTNSMIGRVQFVKDGSIICFKTRAQAEWALKSLRDAVDHAWGSE